jgi:glycosidase
MNYMFSYLCRDFFAKRCIGVQEFDEQIQKSLMRYPWPVTQVQMNFLDSHDVARFLSHCEDDGRRLQLACFFLLMFPGVPSIFYGDECFITGETEDEYRAAMPWNRVDNDFVTHLREWIDLRKSSKALTRGDYRSVYYDDALYVFCRRYEDEQVYVVINYGQADVDVSSRENLSFLGDVRVPAMAGVCIRGEEL